MLHKLTTRIFSLIVRLTSGQQNFVLSNLLSPDNPIIYTSEGFHKLIGYTRKQVRRLDRIVAFWKEFRSLHLRVHCQTFHTAIVTVFLIFNIDSIGWDPLAPRNRNPLDILLSPHFEIEPICRSIGDVLSFRVLMNHIAKIIHSQALPTVLACTFFYPFQSHRWIGQTEP